MWSQFFFESAHFAINLLSSLCMFGVGWLYLDAASLKKTPKEIFKFAGFLLLSFTFLLKAAHIESVLIPDPIFGTQAIQLAIGISKFLSLLLIILGLLLDPLEAIPNRPQIKKSLAVFGLSLPSVPIVLILNFINPLLFIFSSFLYLRRATIGLENHLKTVALAFYLFSTAEILTLGSLFISTQSLGLYLLVRSFGPLWIFAHYIQLAASLILLKWVFYYLFKRLETQIFFIYVCSIVSIFLITVVSFTFLLVKNVENDTVKKLQTDVKVLDYALTSKLEEVTSDAQTMAQNPQIQEGLNDLTRKTLVSQTENVLLTKKLDTLQITDANGQVMIRAEDRERFGDSVSSDPLLKRALTENISRGASLKDNVLTPIILLRSAVSFNDSKSELLGAVIAGITIDNAFVDGLKTATGLEITAWAGNKISATTLLDSSEQNRLIGLILNDTDIQTKVLKDGQAVTSVVNLGGTSYLTSFLPVLDSDEVPIGMISVSIPQISVLTTAGRSLEIAFLISVALIFIAIFPSRYISNFIVSQIN